MRTTIRHLKSLFLGILLFSFVLLPPVALSQSLSLKTTKTSPSIDGKVGKGEYSLSIDIKDGKVFLSKTKNILFAAIKVKTKGWVAMGFNSLRMNNADIVIGYVTNGKGVVKQQKGAGRTHKDSEIPYLLKYGITENKDYTTLEVELRYGKDKKSLYFSDQTLKMIVAYGTKDNIKSYHKFRKPISVKLIK